MRILVTGGSGFVGRALLSALSGRAELCGSGRGAAPEGLGGGVAWTPCDLLAEGAAANLVERVRPDVLVHAAWHTRPGGYLHDREENAAWLAASERLLEAFATAGGRRFVGIGSCAEYAAGSEPCHETRTPLSDATAYAAAKATFFRRLESLREAGEMESAWARLFFVYGPGEHPSRLVPSLISRLLAGEAAETGPAELRRDYVHVADVARALARLATTGLTGPLNLGSGRAPTIGEIATRLGRLTGRPDLLRVGARPGRPGEAETIVADAGRLREELECPPRVSLDEGLRQAVDGWRNGFELR